MHPVIDGTNSVDPDEVAHHVDFSLPVEVLHYLWCCRWVGISKMVKFYIKVSNVMGKAPSGELFCTGTAVVVFDA